MEIAFITLFGLAFIGGAFLSYVWGRVAWRARCVANGRMDQFCTISTGLFLGSVSNLFIFGPRAYDGLRVGVDPSLTTSWWSGILVAGLLLMGISKWMLMWAVELSPTSKPWLAFIGVSFAWVFAVPLFLLGDF